MLFANATNRPAGRPPGRTVRSRDIDRGSPAARRPPIRPRRPTRSVKVTPVGIRYLLLSLAVGLAAVNTANNLLYLLFAMMLSLVLVSGLLSERALRRLSAARTLPGRAFADEPLSYRLTLANGKRFMPGFFLRLREPAGGLRITAPELVCPRLDPGARIEFDATLTFHDRGLHRLDGIDVTTAFPFGLFEKTYRVPAAAQTLVYPSVRRMPSPMPRPGAEDRAVEGRRGVGGLHHLREYHVGDDPRYIHWKHSARRAKLIVREPERETSRTVALVFSNRLPPDPLPIHSEWFEEAVRLTASLAAQAIQDGCDVVVGTWSGTHPAGRGRPHLERVLRTLATIAPSPPAPGDRLIPWTLARPAPAPHLILVWDDPAWSRIRPLCERVWVIAQRGQSEREP